jgi:hypothetical protein
MERDGKPRVVLQTEYRPRMFHDKVVPLGSNCDPQAHREAARRRAETREWLRQREHIAHARALAAPSIVPEALEWPRAKRTRAYSR